MALAVAMGRGEQAWQWVAMLPVEWQWAALVMLSMLASECSGHRRLTVETVDSNPVSRLRPHKEATLMLHITIVHTAKEV